MSDKTNKNQLKAQYKDREIIGGVYLTRNTVNNKILLECSSDLQGSKNKFSFTQMTKTCFSQKLQKDWAQYGSDAFIFEVLEEVKMDKAQTREEFEIELRTLKELWEEKLTEKEFY